MSYIDHKRLCADEDCDTCYAKSFASHDRAEYWCDEKNNCTPRSVTQFTSKRFWFNCDKCPTHLTRN